MPIPKLTEPPSTRNNSSRYLRWGTVVFALLAGLVVLQFMLHLVAEAFWFQELNYLNVFRIRAVNRFGLFLLASSLSAFVLFSNLRLTAVANLAYLGNSSSTSRTDRSLPSERDTPLTLLDLPSIGRFRLRVLLPLALVLSAVLIAVFVYHGQIALSHWHPHISDYQPSPVVPFSINISAIGTLLMTLRQWPIVAGVGAAMSVAMLFYPRWILRAIALVMSIEFGVIMAEQWPRVLLALHPSSFNEVDPLFQRDLGFYIFQLPVWTLLSFWIMGLSVIAILSAVLLYLLSGNSLSRGRFDGFTVPQLRHLFGIGSALMGAIALMYWVKRYELLYSPRGVAYGASYTDVVVQLPVYTGLSILAMIVSALLLVYALVIRVQLNEISKSFADGARIIHSPSGVSSPISPIVVKRSTPLPSSTARISPAGSGTTLSQSVSARQSEQRSISSQNGQSDGRRNGQSNGRPNGRPNGQPNRQENGQRARLSPYRLTRTPVWVAASVLVYWAIATLTGTVLPGIVQRAVVQPNELQLETPFIERSIALTREALSLDRINSETFVPQAGLTAEDVENNPQTISNIRLWDARPLLETNRQLQRIRLYYEFNDADVDRYTITQSTGESELRQVLISARELNYTDLSEDAKTWVNEHLIYTHGYGFTMSPVNTAGDDGLPDYFISGIDHIASNDAVRRSIPVHQPRIYYGELTDTYVMTQTQVRELDYPSGDENEYNTYDGNGGIPIAQFWRRIMYANHLGDWRMLLNRSFTPDTRLLYRRNIKDRVRAIAPFLQFDSDPYLVIADISSDTPMSDAMGESRLLGDTRLAEANQRLQRGLTQTPPNTLYWIIDAYTTSQYFPYADPIDRDFNYIRNSVKVVIDAYNGTTAFFVADETDPIIQSWDEIFPDMFLPLNTMPTSLREHIRYPQDYYQAQSQHLLIYHMTDPQVFYNREDEWRTPTEIYANEQQVVEPYYLTMRLPTGADEEFILFRPFTPIQRRNLIAWLAARSDGDRYGTQLLYTFPKQELVFGPEQIEARINQDPVISQQISLWNREGSRAVQGNLLVIPIEQSLLYVEPLYLEAEQNSLPTLARVIVVFANQIAMAPTLEEALNAVFQVSDKEEAPTIVRPVDEIDIESLDGEDLITPNLNNEQPQTNGSAEGAGN